MWQCPFTSTTNYQLLRSTFNKKYSDYYIDRRFEIFIFYWMPNFNVTYMKLNRNYVIEWLWQQYRFEWTSLQFGCSKSPEIFNWPWRDEMEKLLVRVCYLSLFIRKKPTKLLKQYYHQKSSWGLCSRKEFNIRSSLKVTTIEMLLMKFNS